jgi:DNA mismatch repair protein MutS
VAVISEARRYLEQLEFERDRQRTAAGSLPQLPLFGATAPAASDPLRTALADLDPDALSPKAALETLYRLKRLLGRE